MQKYIIQLLLLTSRIDNPHSGSIISYMIRTLRIERLAGMTYQPRFVDTEVPEKLLKE